KARLGGFPANCPAAIPVPDNAIVNAGFEALEVNVTLPVAAPAASGENVTVKLALAPGANVSGVGIPPRLKQVPLIAALDRVILVVPALLKTPERVWAVPTITLPNASLDGLLTS